MNDMIHASIDLPPTKRRRGLAGSIVSTAWSAALIGTAVGLTVYKLWRNRGAQDESGHVEDSKIDEMVVENERTPEPSSPPPPYNQEWTAIDYPQQQQHLLTPRGREKARQRVIPRSARKPRRERLTVPRKSATTGRSSASSSRPPIPPEFDFESPRKRGRSSYGANAEEEEPHDQADDPDDKMDWIGGKLAQLIEEGKKALGKEVVVMSDAKEDEVDDGSGAWVSDEEDRGRLKRRGSTRSRRSMTFTNGHGVYPSTSSAVSSSSSGNLLAPPTAPTTPRKTHSRGFSHDGMGSPALSVSAAAHEEPSNWESPEIREMMERARAKYASRAGR
ncbi:hypothetical protein CC1G_05729 [Coprinopsis cinerea okayama7|uniref:Uncharacterized protein n=1 Tax=Coprinopsis cinerea (strain Okayama-7 / 130 / ATCC MYA-4618 / FGSC 9003) TaxID=240176 RepID=A8NA02_COPC7|nr:hypothetical protein CC1G_05729 [Coprinopsis cinerea okayama7\|eukprot:XP_001831658.1 hypothetical protein CC1G_05729 [Coprinopsis cinerea okayama7\